MAFPLTDEQKKIVDDRGGELLVSPITPMMVE